MTEKPDDLVRAGAGSLAQVNLWHDLLGEAGIDSRTVGQDLAAGLGSVLPGTVQLWVHRADADAASGLIDGHGAHSVNPAAPATLPDRQRAHRPQNL